MHGDGEGGVGGPDDEGDHFVVDWAGLYVSWFAYAVGKGLIKGLCGGRGLLRMRQLWRVR